MAMSAKLGRVSVKHGVASLRNTVPFTKAVIIGALVGATLLSAVPTQPVEAAQARSVLRVRNDPGGVLADRVAYVNQLRARGTQVRIEAGYCNSACTMYLGLPNVCVSRRATFGFHGPMSQFYGMPLPAAEFEYWSGVMASYYPGQIRGWYMQKARYTLVGTEQLTGRQLIRMGVRECT